MARMANLQPLCDCLMMEVIPNCAGALWSKAVLYHACFMRCTNVMCASNHLFRNSCFATHILPGSKSTLGCACICRPGASEAGPRVSAAMAADQSRSSDTLLNTHLSPQNYDPISFNEPNKQVSPASAQSPSATADPRGSKGMLAGSAKAHGPEFTTPVDSVASGLASQLKPRPQGSGDIAELQRQLQQMHSRQGRAGSAKTQQQRQSQSPAAQRSASLTASPSVSGGLSLSANQSASLSASPSPRAVSRGPGMEGRSPNLDANVISPFSQPKASPAHQDRSPSIGRNTFLGTQDREPPAAQHNLPPAPASGLLVASHVDNSSPASQLTAFSNAPATAIPAGQRRASPAGLPRASLAAQRTQSPADRPTPSQAAQTSFAAHERPRASPAAQQRASPAPECTAPLQAEPTIAGASTQHAGGRLLSSLPSFMALHGQLERQLPDLSKEALARSMGAPPPAVGTTHSQTVANNMSGSASASGADYAQQVLCILPSMVLLHERPVVRCYQKLSSTALQMQKEGLPDANPEKCVSFTLHCVSTG